MEKKMLRLLKLSCEAKQEPQDIVGYAIENDTDAKVIETMDDTAENREKARVWLEEHRKLNECCKRGTYSGSVYTIEAYAVEYFIGDEDGELIEGSDFDV